MWRRACGIHLCAKPTIHWHWALFETRHPAELDELDNNNKIEPIKSFTPLEIFTQLEGRLPDSALVCARRTDAMRREGKPVGYFSILVVSNAHFLNRNYLNFLSYSSATRSDCVPAFRHKSAPRSRDRTDQPCAHRNRGHRIFFGCHRSSNGGSSKSWRQLLGW